MSCKTHFPIFIFNRTFVRLEQARNFDMAKRKLTYIDLFCGAGGLSLGFDRQGFENVFSLDIEPACCKTYSRNFPLHRIVQKDISDLSGKEVRQLVGRKKIDVVIGGPPCQGFSIAGPIGRRFIADPRNRLFQEFARIVSVVKPTLFLMENVARLFTHNQGRTREEIVSIFNDLGYRVECKILNAADYGVPQLRSRAIFIGSKLPRETGFPKASVSEPQHYATVEETIGSLPPLVAGETSDIPNHRAMRHSAQMLRKMAYVEDGGDRTNIPETLRPKSGDVRKYIRYASGKPSVCITGDMRKVFHYRQNRALTVRELARIQSFPDDFVFLGTQISQQQQVGNAVPPMLAEALAQHIKRYLRCRTNTNTRP